MYRRSVTRARISTISLSMTWLSPGILHWTRQLRITRFSSSKSQSDARRYNRRFLYWKQVSHSSANCTLRLLNAVVIIVIWIRYSHTKPLVSHTKPLVPAFAGEWKWEDVSFGKIRHHPLHREGSRSCIAWCNGNRHPAAAWLRGSRGRPTYSPVGCSRKWNFRAVHAEIILEASSGGAAKNVTAWHCLGHIPTDVYQGAHTWRTWPRCSLESRPKRADSWKLVRISSR